MSQQDNPDELSQDSLEYVLESIRKGLASEELQKMRLVRRKFVEDLFQISRSTIYTLMSEESFPAPVTLPGNGCRWLLSELSDWVNQRIDERGQK